MSATSIITSKRQYIEVKDIGRGAFGRCTLARTIVGNKTYVVKEIKFEKFKPQKQRASLSARSSSSAGAVSAGGGDIAASLSRASSALLLVPPPTAPAVENPEDEENAEMAQMIRDQGPLLATLKHVNIVKGFGSFEEDGIFYVVTEYCDSGDLSHAILERKTNGYKFFTEARIFNWMVQLAMAVTYLHDHCILHRDIKPSNVFLQNNGRIVKLGSFGIARKLASPDGFLMGQIGTMTHMPPEMCEGRAVTLNSDVWSFGVTIYELASFSLPVPKSLPANVYSEGLRLLIETELLNKEPQNRPTMRQLIGDGRVLNAIAEMVINTDWGFK